MSHYKHNLRDLEFTLFEVLGRDQVLGTGPFADVDGETARDMLAEVARLATEDLAASLLDSDRNPPVFDPATHSVTPARVVHAAATRPTSTPSGGALDVPAELGGTRRPAQPALGRSPRWCSAPTPAVHMYTLGLVLRQGPAHGWAPRTRSASRATMVENALGRHHGAHRARRRLRRRRRPHQGRAAARRHLAHHGRQALHHLGEHDMHDNIVHLVLARPEGAGPGTKGLSLFVVPKFHVDLETGELGDRNGVFVTNVEHKMGLKVSTTCELTFGEVDGPGGRLPARRRARRHRPDVPDHRGRPDDGRHQGDRHPVDRLPQRPRVRQGAGPGRRPRADGRQDRAARDHHPPPRRPPLADAQKAYAEGLRALVLYTACQQDAVQLAEAARRARRTRRAGQRPAAAARQGRRLRAVVGAARDRESCRPSAAPASCRTTRSSSTSATRRSTPSTRARRRSRAWTSSSARSSATRARR